MKVVRDRQMRDIRIPFNHRRLVAEELEARLCLSLERVSDFPMDNTYFLWEPEAVAKLGDQVLFHAPDATGSEVLWVTNALGEAVQLRRFGFPPPGGAFIGGAVFRDRYYFGVSPESFGPIGMEVWSTDGTVDGTELFFEFETESRLSICAFRGALDDEFYFSYGNQIMVSDGTRDGTFTFRGSAEGMTIRVGDVSLQTNGQRIWGLSQGAETIVHIGTHDTATIEVLGNLAYFISGVDLWVTDGTYRGTRPILSAPAETSYAIEGRFHDELIVLATMTDDEMSSLLLVNLQNRETRTITVVDSQSPVPYSAEVNVIHDRIVLTSPTTVASVAIQTGDTEILAIPGADIFVAHAVDDFLLIRTDALRLWRTDGTREGTYQLAPETASVELGRSTEYTYFVNLWREDIEIWRGDRALLAAQVFMTIEDELRWAAAHADLIIQDNLVLLTFTMGTGYEAWITADGDGEFHRVQAVDPGLNWYPVDEIVAQSNHLFVLAGVTEFSLWSVSSTESQLKNMRPDIGALRHAPAPKLVPLGNGVLFSAGYVENRAAWVSDGENQVMLTDLHANIYFATSSSVVLQGVFRLPPQDGYTFVDGATQTTREIEIDFANELRLVNAVSTPTYTYLQYGGGSIAGDELWRVTSDMGDAIRVGEGPRGPMHVVGETLLYFCETRRVCSVGRDLSQWSLGDKIISRISQLVSGSKYAYLIAGDRSLWRTDGTPSGTIKLIDVASDYLKSADNKAYFQVHDPEYGVRLWETDGTYEGTRVATWWPADRDPPDDVFSVGGAVYVQGASEQEGKELWRVDERSGSAILVQDLWPGPIGSVPQELNSVQNDLYFFANDGVHGRQLWRKSHDRLDLNHDEMVDQYDLDAILGSFGLGLVRPSPLDVVADRKIDEIDAAFWLDEAGTQKIGRAYEFGDANLDGVIDAIDYGMLYNSLGHQTSRWSQGDFNFDSRVDILDFEIWDAQRFQEQTRGPASSTRIPRAAGTTQGDVRIPNLRQATATPTPANAAPLKRSAASQLSTLERREATALRESDSAHRRSRFVSVQNYSTSPKSTGVSALDETEGGDKPPSTDFDLAKLSMTVDGHPRLRRSRS